MRRRRSSALWGRVALRAAGVAVALSVGWSTMAAAAAEPPTQTPIKHFLMLMQKGHSFDNYFGTYPGADGIPRGACMPLEPARGPRPCVRPWHLGDRSAGLPHGRETFRQQYRGGHMDGFVSSLGRLGVEDPRAPMGYYDRRDIPLYWNLADRYVLFDRFFSAAAGGSVMNHVYWTTGTPGDVRDPELIPINGFGRQTIFDRLDKAGISWKIYVEHYDPRQVIEDARRHEHRAPVTWMPVLSYGRFLGDPRRFAHIVDASQLFADADAGRLPAVAYIVSTTSSEHPPGGAGAGMRFVRRLVNALMLSPEWSSSAFLWTYDTWGGWYDHVKPPKVDAYGNGFRVPALLIGPYARRGHVDHTQLDVTSALRFIEDNWVLPPLAARDAHAHSFIGAFDFAAGPRAPEIPPLDRAASAPRHVRVRAIYAGYGGAALVAVLLLGWAGLGPRRRRTRTLAAHWRGARE